MSRTICLVIGALSVVAMLLGYVFYDSQPSPLPPVASQPEDEVVPQDDRASQKRVQPRHVGPQENRPGDLRFIPIN